MIYGQPSADVFKLSNQPTFLDGLFTSLDKLPLTDINDAGIKEQLAEIKEKHDTLAKDELLLKRYKLFDQSLYQYVYHFNFINDDDTITAYKSTIRSLFNDIVPLIYKLKLHYQRPRPFQLAALHKVALYPELSSSGQCPAFPSMHACMGYVMSDVCSNLFPQTVKYFQDLGDDLCRSRIEMGLCMPDDLQAGKTVAGKVLQEKEFKIKYKL